MLYCCVMIGTEAISHQSNDGMTTTPTQTDGVVNLEADQLLLCDTHQSYVIFVDIKLCEPNCYYADTELAMFNQC